MAVHPTAAKSLRENEMSSNSPPGLSKGKDLVTFRFLLIVLVAAGGTAAKTLAQYFGSDSWPILKGEMQWLGATLGGNAEMYTSLVKSRYLVELD